MALQRIAWSIPPSTEIEEYADKTEVDFWKTKPRLMDLLRLPFRDDAQAKENGEIRPGLQDPQNTIAAEWSLDGLDVERLLETSPRRERQRRNTSAGEAQTGDVKTEPESKSSVEVDETYISADRSAPPRHSPETTESNFETPTDFEEEIDDFAPSSSEENQQRRYRDTRTKKK
jgi:hypothetical protein